MKIIFARWSGSKSTKISCRWDGWVLNETLALRRAWGRARGCAKCVGHGGCTVTDRYHTNLKHLQGMPGIHWSSLHLSLLPCCSYENVCSGERWVAEGDKTVHSYGMATQRRIGYFKEEIPRELLGFFFSFRQIYDEKFKIKMVWYKKIDRTP